jgi:hypothetical protein
LVADLVVNKPLKLSPSYIEFKRAHLYNVNPVGFGSMLVASGVSIAAYFHAFGQVLYAFSPFLALAIAFIMSPVLAWATKGKYYIAREDTLRADADASPESTLTCVTCQREYEVPDMAHCPFHGDAVCSLCCTLEKNCHDACKGPAAVSVEAGTPVSVGAP